MNQPNERDILSLYNTSMAYPQANYINPYLGVDYPVTLDYRFKVNHFVNADGWYLNYLVSRLDGDTYDDVIDLVDRIISTDKSGEKKWILDDKPTSNPNVMKYSTMPLASTRLNELEFNCFYDDLDSNITYDNDEVIGYSSHGYYAFWNSSYIRQLQFDYSNGAIFNSWESGNALSYGKWHSNFGHLSDFIGMGGSGGGGNVDEPTTAGVNREGDAYPAYAMGYSIVDAIYQGINYIAWQNDVIGDPLQTIAWGKQTLTQNLTWSGTNLVTGAITVPSGKTLTIANNAVINFKHLGSLQVDGALVIQPGAELNFHNGKSIVVNGSLNAQGVAENKITLDFNNSPSPGIKVSEEGAVIITHCDILNAQYGIITDPRFNSVKAQYVNVTNCHEGGIVLYGSTGGNPETDSYIKNCTVINSDLGIYIANISEIVILENILANCNMGLGVSQVQSAFIINNNISSATPAAPGIFMHSSFGNIRGNTITNHSDGIYVANSSPDIGGNTLLGNLYHGLYIAGGSIPNLEAYLAGQMPVLYAISGYNTIKENGNDANNEPEDNDGSEIYLNRSNIRLAYGCNIIADDRTSTPELSTLLLIGGRQDDFEAIKAVENNWGNIPPSEERFSRDLSVDFIPYNQEPCTIPQIACEELMVKTSRGELIQVIPARDCDARQLTSLESDYAEANTLYLTGEVSTAMALYQQIAQSQNTIEAKLYAYNKLYTIGNLIDTTDNYFTSLQSIFNDLSQTVSDSTLINLFSQNGILCKVSKEEYISAINDFDNIIQQNPESEQAVFAEINIITTALLLDTTNNQLGKVANGKYSFNGNGDYLVKLNRILKKGTGKGFKDENKLVPSE